MGKMTELSEIKRNSIITLHSEGYTERGIAVKVGVAKSTVHDTLVRYRNHKTLGSMPRIGRPKATYDRIDKKIKSLAENSNEPNAVDIANSLAEMNLATISPQTVRNRLHQFELYGRNIISKPLLTNTHQKKRLAFAKKYQNWTINDWKKVLWSDESKINLHGSDGRRFTWRKPGERLLKKHVKQTIKHDKSIMVWGCFGWNGVGNLHVINGTLTSAKYVRILKDHMVPSAERLFQDDYIFQQDNDPKHTAKNTKSWFESNRIELLNWPPQSPDLNPIENLWYQLKTGIHKEKIHKIRDLPATLEQCWENLSIEKCRKLIESMPNRIDEVIKSKGSWTKY